MAASVTLKIEPRQGRGTQTTRKLRRTGRIPGVVYGHKEATVSVSLGREDFESALRHGARLVELSHDGKGESALVQDVQWDHLGKEILHVDFRRVSKDERVIQRVPIHLRGVAPGVNAGGVLDQPMHVIEIECLITAIPDHIRVNIGEMQIGSIIHVRELTMPPEVKALSDPDAIVVQVQAQKAEAAAPLLGAADSAEPEVIGRKKEEEAGEEEK